MHPHAKYFHAFNSFNEKIGPARFKKLFGYFGDLKRAWTGSEGDYLAAGLEEKLAREIVLRKKTFDLDAEFQKLVDLGVEVLTVKDAGYPARLKEIYNPPFILYKKGDFSPRDDFALGIVGSRKLSAYGRQVALTLARDLTLSGLTIVSGLAQGIDSLAHRQALEAGGRTLAVIGSGIDERSIFPSLNRRLAEEIVKNGVLMSEYPPGTFALKHHFPARNRIISGLSLGVLVIEAAEKSGALITARHALEQNREVFAVPGPITSKTSAGPNQLIKLGAKPVSQVQDILEELNLQSIQQTLEAREILPDNEEERKILEVLEGEPVHVDKIIELTTLDTAKINSVLSIMELKGKIRNLGGMNYIKNN